MAKLAMGAAAEAMGIRRTAQGRKKRLNEEGMASCIS
jgi:hypothetical protein